MTGGWLLWDQRTNKLIQLASVIFPKFQPYWQPNMPAKGSLLHIMNTMTLGEVPTEQYFEEENRAIGSLPLVKDVKIPFHLGKALKGPHCKDWRKSCEVELAEMATRDVWEIVEKVPGMKTIGHRWVFDLKNNANGSIEKFKARLVAHGDKQCLGVDCAKTYTPTASLMSLHLVLAATVLKGWKMASFDVSGAYLYSPVDKMAVITIWIHVDNGVVTSNSSNAISDFKMALVSQLNIKWSNQLERIAGLECVFGKGEVAITQWQLMDSILEAYTRQVVTCDLPLPVLPVGGSTPNMSPLDATPFWSVIGSLAYLVSGSRPDLAFVVNYLARHSMGPTPAHWDLLDHVLGDTPVLWGLKQQSVVALSTCAVEYIALCDSTQHLVQAINQLNQLVSDFDKTIFCNNQAAVQVLLDNKSCKWMRYLDCAFFFVNNTICKYGIKVTWVKMDNMLADALTKRLSGPTLLRSLPFLGITTLQLSDCTLKAARDPEPNSFSSPHQLQLTELELTGKQALLHLALS
ncbi:hypothetical protein O181_085126 [Austropuccinia psidii MF-1]|uniref:Reverse transcriptase Ty1/copia-type domain-containing protein n=1 Tax=Austropuccinia psidii MF-1 TaxID=1389203 RepID=A0A9Q3IJG0_9BASI|nr:hypothetical protein [Austropuccinia psidii MF-1]